MDFMAAPLQLPSVQKEIWDFSANCDNGLNANQLYALDRLVKRLKAAGYWNSISLMLFMCCDDPLLQPYNCILKGYAAPSVVGQLPIQPGYGAYAPDYASELDLGITIDQIPGITLNGNVILDYIVSDDPTSYGDCGATLGAATSTTMRFRNGNRMYLWNFSQGPTQQDVKTAVGLNGSVRIDSTRVFTVKDDLTTDFPQAAVTNKIPTSNVKVFRSGESKGNGAAGHSFTLYMAGGSVQKTDIPILRSILEGYHYDMGSLAAIRVPPAPPFTGPFYFTQAMLKQSDIPNLQVTYITGLPHWTVPNDDGSVKDDNTITNATYAFFPLTNVQTRLLPQNNNSNRTDITVAYYHWVNRARGPSPGNPTYPYLRGNDGNTVAINLKNANGQSVTGKTTYDSYNNAALASILQIMYVLDYKPYGDTDYQPNGVPTGWVDRARTGGVDVSKWDALKGLTSDPNTDPNFRTDAMVETGLVCHSAYVMANTGNYFNQPSLTANHDLEARELIILPPLHSAQYTQPIVGVELDFETADFRSADSFAAFLKELADICHAKGKYLALQCDPPGVLGNRKNPDGTTTVVVTAGGSGAKAGFTRDSAYLIMRYVDIIGIQLSRYNIETHGGFAAYIADFLSYFTGPNGDQPLDLTKLRFGMGMGGRGQEFTEQQCQDVHDYALAHGINKFHTIPLFANYVSPGTSTPNLRRAVYMGIPKATS